MDKLDLKKARRELFTAPLNRFVEVDVPPCCYLMVDGHGDPNTVDEYRQAVEWLFTTAYALKFLLKESGRDFVVSPLEGLWTSSDPNDFVARRKSEWDWTMMIMVPDFVDEAHFEAATAQARRKRGEPPITLRLETYDEGMSFQALHIGSYDDEGPLLARLHHDMAENGYDFSGPHHEVYLSDPRRTAADKLKTILRQPVRRKT